MKFKVGDTVLVTGGKDKGKQGKIVKILPDAERVVVEGVNLYIKHIKPYGGKPGDRVRKERALPTANVAIFNPETKKIDRIGYMISKDNTKVRIYKKTQKAI